MMKMSGSSHDRNQLAPSIEKLLHYLAVHVKTNTLVRVYDGDTMVFSHQYEAPREISVSPTLYTRIDDCHGAGNCCRVPFDLVYTDYDRQRILDYNHEAAVRDFGGMSADRFLTYRDLLLERLVPLRVDLSWHHGTYACQQSGNIVPQTVHREARLWVQRNTETFRLSGNKSCPYLFTETDRYYCGIHLFKPLHCWYPHMTVRVTQRRDPYAGCAVSIGRMQYGRNHKFGCPVLFSEATADEPNALFGAVGVDSESYFKQQFQSDIDKLEWTSKSAESMGFSSDHNFAVGIHEQFQSKRDKIRMLIASGKPSPISLWRS